MYDRTEDKMVCPKFIAAGASRWPAVRDVKTTSASLEYMVKSGYPGGCAVPEGGVVQR